MRVNFRHLNAAMPQEFGNLVQIGSILNQLARKGMAEFMEVAMKGQLARKVAIIRGYKIFTSPSRRRANLNDKLCLGAFFCEF